MLWQAARLAARSLTRATAGWRDDGSQERELTRAAQQVSAEVTVVDLGPVGDETKLRDELPTELFTFMVGLMDAAREGAVQALARGRAELSRGRNWGVRLRLRDMPERLTDVHEAAPPVTAGPYADPALLERVVAELGDLMWIGVQAEEVARRILERELGPQTDVLEDYARAYLSRDAEEGTYPDGTSVAAIDADLRRRYVALARRSAAAGDHERAAMFLKPALDSLGSAELIMAAPRYSLIEHVPQADGDTYAVDDGGRRVRADGLAADLLAEFPKARPHLDALRAKEHSEVHRFSLLADEAIAVWREFAVAYLLRHRVVFPAFPGTHRTPAQVLMQYEHAQPESVYVQGFVLAAQVAENVSSALLTSGIGKRVLWMPLDLLRARLPISSLNRLDDGLTPTARLRALAAARPQPADGNWARCLPNWLDGGCLPPFAYIHTQLDEQMAGCP